VRQQWDRLLEMTTVSLRVVHSTAPHIPATHVIGEDERPVPLDVVPETHIPLLALRVPEEARTQLSAWSALLMEHVTGSFSIIYQFDCADEDFSLATQCGSTIYKLGLCQLSDISTLPLKLRQKVYPAWRAVLAGYRFAKDSQEALAAPIELVGAEYCKLWMEKDGLSRAQWYETVHGIVKSYWKMACIALHQHKLDDAAEFSFVVRNTLKWLNSQQMEAVPGPLVDWFFAEMKPVRDRWRFLDAQVSLITGKLQTAAQEGIAEWFVVRAIRYEAQDEIGEAWADVGAQILSPEDERARILARSRSNPYRLGFELTERLAETFGEWFLGQPRARLLYWPIDTWSRLVPVGRLRDNPLLTQLAPSERLARLAKLPAGIRWTPRSALALPHSLESVLDLMSDLHALLDGSLPGLLIAAGEIRDRYVAEWVVD
jgi:hypothetical protein